MEKVIRQLEENNVEAESDADTINKIWKAMEEAILEAANKQIPKKKVFNTKITRRQNQRKQQYRHIIELQRIVKKAKTKENQEAEENEREETNNKLRAIGAEIGVSLSNLHRQWSKAWIEDIKGWQRIFKEKKKEDWKKFQRKQIEENTNRRYEMIKS